MRAIAISLCFLVIMQAFSTAIYNIKTVITTQVYIPRSVVWNRNVNTNVNHSVHHGSVIIVNTVNINSNFTEKYVQPSVANKPRYTRKAGDMSKKKCEEYYPPISQTQNVHYGGRVPERKPVYASTTEKVYFMWRGMQTLAKEFPHMALIGLMNDTVFDRWICGGSLISHNFILTAAHCLISKNMVVRLGELDTLTATETETQDFGIKKLFPHPNYTTSMFYHDIGLIELEKPVTLTQYIGIACLGSRKELDEEQILTVTGWGRTQWRGSFNNYLLKVDVHVTPHSICNKGYKNDSMLSYGIVDDTQICAVGLDGEDACEGDSGGPLQVFNKYHGLISVYNILGVTSFGPACGYSSEDNPGVYTRVHYYLSWIENIVWP